MKKTRQMPVTIFLLGLLLIACGRTATTLTPSVERTSTGRQPAPAWKAWEQDWENTLARARAEGTLTIYNNWGSDVRTALFQAFRQKFGIQVEFVVFSRSEESVVKIQMEKRAGMYIADLFSGAGPTQVVVMKQAGLLGPVEPLLILPEVTDPGAWTGGSLPFVDKDKQVIAMAIAMQRSVMYHTDLVKKGEITSYRDLLKPQYKGRMTMNDPTVAVNGLS